MTLASQPTRQPLFGGGQHGSGRTSDDNGGGCREQLQDVGRRPAETHLDLAFPIRVTNEISVPSFGERRRIGRAIYGEGIRNDLRHEDDKAGA